MWRIPPCLVTERPPVTIHSRPRYGGCAHAACWADAALCSQPRHRSRPPRCSGPRCWWSAACSPAGLGGGRGRAAHGRGAGPGATTTRGGAACERGHLAYAATLLGVRDRADEARAALGRAAALLAPGGPAGPLLDFRRGLLAENLARLPAGGPRRVPPRPRGRHRARRPAAALLHLAPSGRTRPAGRRVGGGTARLRRIAADPRGVGLPGRHGPGAGRAGRRRAGTGGVPAARGGGPAVPAAGRRTDLAGPPAGPRRPAAAGTTAWPAWRRGSGAPGTAGRGSRGGPGDGGPGVTARPGARRSRARSGQPVKCSRTSDRTTSRSRAISASSSADVLRRVRDQVGPAARRGARRPAATGRGGGGPPRLHQLLVAGQRQHRAVEGPVRLRVRRPGHPAAAAAAVASASGRSSAQRSAGHRAGQPQHHRDLEQRPHLGQLGQLRGRRARRPGSPGSGTTSTAPSRASCCIASRTGVAETPKRSPSAGAEYTSPGRQLAVDQRGAQRVEDLPAHGGPLDGRPVRGGIGAARCACAHPGPPGRRAPRSRGPRPGPGLRRHPYRADGRDAAAPRSRREPLRACSTGPPPDVSSAWGHYGGLLLARQAP